MPRLLARVVRWGLPAALLIAALVAASGLRGLLFSGPSDAAHPASVADLNGPPPSTGAALTPQGVGVPICREIVRPCGPTAGPPAADAVPSRFRTIAPGCCP